jgi:transmembrane sensor
MMSESNISRQAVDWALRVVEPDFADWEAFTMWLEEDGAHARAYDAALAAADEADRVLPELPVEPARTIEPVPRRRWGWAAGGGELTHERVAPEGWGEDYLAS